MPLTCELVLRSLVRLTPMGLPHFVGNFQHSRGGRTLQTFDVGLFGQLVERVRDAMAQAERKIVFLHK
ncbi:uncharacterized protein PHALS_00254 [Plasmopara halstedii]|uniref:Uncharacterized protein n=1 Tax=Plasmopara halstedii TaxID=4781 RepID=A0A0P1A5T2_PLAHL|nr:uncharacterized protein PHALS_00254 [Plasmopara halstedii]CEG35930.1 hypothetical protein PHALS_00254 [Plasmopara halstedii]|eukprot:XP_024572299.1 hypothetical protein PHALS_00254 [Plasmopara halstedii]